MTIDEAIKILEGKVALAEMRNTPKKFTAERLGIEALKDIKMCRILLVLDPKHLLEGETEE